MRNQHRLQIKIWSAQALPPNWFKRVPKDAEASKTVEKNTEAIIDKVAKNGDAAIVEFTEKFDKTKLDPKGLQATREEVKEAYQTVSQEQISALKFMKEKISNFEKHVLVHTGLQTSEEGISVRSVLRPIESVGCYVPGGQAAYPSTLVMTATPAKAAGVSRIVVCSPPNTEGKINPLVLVAADLCEVDEVYKVGGAQAIAALAYGTQTIKPVKKIVGPGSKYVTMAKVLVSKDVAIDMPAGPSEVLVLADEAADAELVAADMISQAEHGADSVTGLITTSQKLAGKVLERLNKTVNTNSMDRGQIIENALDEYGFIITCESVEQMIELANVFAPEHLEIITRNPVEVANKVTSAGVVLLGPYSPVALSDYGSGTNHVLPTGGFGHTYSGLSALDFVRRINIVESTKEGLQKVKNQVKILTQAENLPNHYKSIEARFKN